MRNNLKAGLLIIALSSLSIPGWAANGDKLVQLDQDRSNLLNEITNQLSYGYINVADAERLNGKLDNVVAMETKYKEGHQKIEFVKITNALKAVRVDLQKTISPKKVWMGIDSHNMALKEKIDAALNAGKLNKDEASNLELEEATIRNGETVNDTSNGLQYDDAVSTAKQINQLNAKIDRLSSR